MKGRRSVYLYLFLVSILAIALVPRPLHGQRSTNTIVGTVTDTSGAVIPGAEVTVQNHLTGVRNLPVKTDEQGYFVVTELLEGDYVLQVEKDGFSTLERSGIHVTINETVKVDMQLQLGTSQQKITVVGRAPLINSENAQLSVSQTPKEVSDLPTSFSSAGRSIMDLMQMGAGGGLPYSRIVLYTSTIS